MTRGDRLTEVVRERELSALVVTNLENVHYLSGYTGTNGVAVVGAEGQRDFFTDFRYLERAEVEVRDFERLRGKRDLLGDAAERLSAGRVGFEEEHMSVRSHRRFEGLVPEGVELVGVHGLVEGLREVKEEGELAIIRRAAALADDALAEALEGGLAGRTEREFAMALEDGFRARGAEPSFESIVASGPNGSLPHAEPGDTVIAEDVLVTVDYGAKIDGYCSDCTRTFATGEVGAEAREVYELVRAAQAAAGEAIRAGLGCKEADSIARAVIDDAGHAEHFGHGLGHGVGLEVHEGPRLTPAASEEETLVAGNVVTVEPGVYLPGRLGVRIEDLVVVTEDGSEVLSQLPKDLTVVGET
ncbi:MAG: aminopeptidase P family protein [Thermoleophilaceae bacterium]|nr:aminopeptidase P family protein [Thermoleophilaceae bacterium]